MCTISSGVYYSYPPSRSVVSDPRDKLKICSVCLAFLAIFSIRVVLPISPWSKKERKYRTPTNSAYNASFSGSEIEVKGVMFRLSLP